MSQAPPQTGPRLELKHTVPADAVPALLEWLRARLDPDPHARDPELPSIRVESIYFDTPSRACYRNRSRHKLPKHRLRRYDGGSPWYLEEKLRVDSRVWKRRMSVTESELGLILDGDRQTDGIDSDGGALEWFRSRFRVLDLVPTLYIGYDRAAFVSPCGGRVTVDQRITAMPVEVAGHGAGQERKSPIRFEFGRFEVHSDPAPVTDLAVVEVKGPPEPSPRMREVVERIDFGIRSYSKYSEGLEAVGLEAVGLEAAGLRAAGLRASSGKRSAPESS